jgi:hypothetical protein
VQNDREPPHSKAAPEPPPDLPADPREFWSVRSGFEGLAPPPETEHKTALELLGSPPFPRGGFPLVGLLASVYEHVTHCAEEAAQGDA